MNDRTSTARRRPAPYSEDAEMALLGAALLSADAFEVAMTEVDTDDFYLPSHGHIHHAMRALWDGGHRGIDAILVWDQIRGMGLADSVPAGTAYLVTLMASCGSTSNARRYATLILETATRRHLIGAAAEISESAYESAEDVDVIAERATRLVSSIGMPTVATPSMTAVEFAEQEFTYDWIVEGLLERRDRLIVTAGEGNGKSTLLRQLSVQLAAGIHPFRFHPVPPVRVLVVDVENSPGVIARQLRTMFGHIVRPWNHDNLRIEARVDGLDLMDRHHVRWLIERVAINAPDVLVTGPIYRLHAEDEADGVAARKVARVFELIRAKYGCAVILEHHSPHGTGERERDLRPIGASLWRRWPEFGYGMRVNRNAEPIEIDGHPAEVWFQSWRGDRERREWPSLLSGDNRYGWPWRDAHYRPPEEDF